MNSTIYIGIDVGAISVKIAVAFPKDSEKTKPFIHSGFIEFSLPNHESWTFLKNSYTRHLGNPDKIIKTFLEVLEEAPLSSCKKKYIITGGGRKKILPESPSLFINPFRAVTAGVHAFYPNAKTIFELGGERSRYIQIDENTNGLGQVLDYEMNSDCAAGTGSFFDQQVGRLKINIEDAGELVQNAKRTAAIAGRCSVFAKSDMIHAQQKGYQPEEVLRGLCDAVVRNFKGSVTKGKSIEPDVVFVGGMAANQGIVDSLRKHFNLSHESLIVPEYHADMASIGAVLIAIEDDAHNDKHNVVLQKSSSSKIDSLSSLAITNALSSQKVKRLIPKPVERHEQSQKVFLGIDVGSVSTNLALLDEKGHLIHGIYTQTQGRPIEVVRDSLKEMVQAVGENCQIAGVGTTGSGRELIGILVGADIVKDEITAHKTGAMQIAGSYLNQEVDTIFEIGGQDSKFISIQNGVVVDFSLNEACAAGTGSFLEEQASQIDVSIKEEFANLALSSTSPLKLGERCTVFMEKEVVPHFQNGVPKKDILAGLSYSVVYNYLNRVVKKRKIGDCIFFQGGTAYNDAVAAAFATILNKEIIIPPHNGIIGAIGVAMLARDRVGESSKFRGWDLDQVQWTRREFTCKACSNQCLIEEFDVEGEKSYWGDKCSDRYRKRQQSLHEPVAQDLIQYKNELLFPVDAQSSESNKRGRIGIPRVLFFYDRLPFWRTFFNALKFEVVLSPASYQKLLNDGIEATVAEPCFPIQTAHGHLLHFTKENVDGIFLPNMVTEEDPTDSIQSFICPWAQTIPQVAKHTPALKSIQDILIDPNIQFRMGAAFVQKCLYKSLKKFKVSKNEIHQAYQKADMIYRENQNKMLDTGHEALELIQNSNEPAVIILGRPYNLYDTGLNLNIPHKLRNIYGVDVIPQDFLNLDPVLINDVHDHMFWNYGRKILQGARYARDFKNMHLIYLSNFKCGPDSYIRHFIEDAYQRPFLFLQLDSHANDAGVMTRIEAFLESKGIL